MRMTLGRSSRRTCGKLWFGVVILLALSAAIPPPALAQGAIRLSSGAAPAGSKITLDLTLSGVPHEGPASLQFKLMYAPAEFSSVDVVAGPAAKKAGKSVSCKNAAGAVNCVVFGLNSNKIVGGVVGVVSVTLAAGSTATTRAIEVFQITAASAAGSAIPMVGRRGMVKVIPGRPDAVR